MIEVVKCQTNFSGNRHRQNFALETLCVMHDAIQCFMYLFPDLNVEDERLDFLYDMAKNKNSELIVRAFEKDKMDMDFDYELFAENEVGNIV
jgi:phosphopantetheine adenylyltransferase